MVKKFDIGPNGASKFNKEILKYPSALVRVHSPGCGHCIAMMPEWSKLLNFLYKRMAGDMTVFDVNFGALNGITHKDLQSVSGFPTILAIHSDRAVVPFEGDRTMDAMLKFSQDNFQIAKKAAQSKKAKKANRSKKYKKGGNEYDEEPEEGDEDDEADEEELDEEELDEDEEEPDADEDEGEQSGGSKKSRKSNKSNKSNKSKKSRKSKK